MVDVVEETPDVEVRDQDVIVKSHWDTLAVSGNLSGSFFAANAVLKAEQENKTINMIARPMFVLMDGGQSQFTSGESVPVPKKVVSDNGTVSTSGFEYIQTGLAFNCGVRESTVDTCRLSVKVGISSVVGFVENSAPITNRQDFTTTAYVKADGVYLLGSVKRNSESNNSSGLFGLLKNKANTAGVVQIWARCYRIGGIKNVNPEKFIGQPILKLADIPK